MLHDFFKQHKGTKEYNPYFDKDVTKPPPFWQHFSVFHRGYGLHVQSELFIDHKINIISQDIFTILKSYAIQFFYFMIGKLFYIDSGKDDNNKKNDNNNGNGKNISNGELIDQIQLMQRMSIEKQLSSYRSSNEMSDNKSDDKRGESESEGKEKEDKKGNEIAFERVSLVDTYKEAKRQGIKGIIWWFLSNLTLKEPTFNDVIVMFRELPEKVLDEKLRRAKERSKKYGKTIINSASKSFKKIESAVKHVQEEHAKKTQAKQDESNANNTQEKKNENENESVTTTTKVTEPVNEKTQNQENGGNNEQPVTSTTNDAKQKQDQDSKDSKDSKNGETSKLTSKSSTREIVDEIGHHHGKSTLEAPRIDTSIIKSDASILRQPIRMNYYSKVPMADLEVVFPCKRLSLRMFERVYLFVILTMGLYVTFKELLFDTNDNQSAASGIFSDVVVIGLILLMIRTIQWYRLTQKNYQFRLNSTLYDATMASDENVLISLLQTVESQELMETILAYYILLVNSHKDESIDDANKVDRLCEALIVEEIGNDSVNVEICDAMRKLRELGLIKMDTFESDVIEVKELNEAIDTVKQHWAAFANEWKHGWNTSMIRTNEPLMDSPLPYDDEN